METQEQAGAEKMNIQKNAICLSLSLGMLRTKRRVATSQIQTDAEPSMVHVSKDILESAQLREVARHHGDIKRFLQSRCLPSPFRNGIYLLRVDLIPEVLEALDNFEKLNTLYVNSFLEFYDRIFRERHDETSAFRAKLGSLYNAKDYPEPSRVKEAFKFARQLWELATPGALRTIDRALYEREAAKMQNVWEEARKQITQVLLQEFQELTARMAERLTPSPDGTVRVFRDSLVGNLQEWLDIFDKRALSDDAELAALVKKARAMVSGIKPEDIRDSDGLRAELAEGMQGLRAQIADSLILQPGRALELDEEGVQA